MLFFRTFYAQQYNQKAELLLRNESRRKKSAARMKSKMSAIFFTKKLSMIILVLVVFFSTIVCSNKSALQSFVMFFFDRKKFFRPNYHITSVYFYFSHIAICGRIFNYLSVLSRNIILTFLSVCFKVKEKFEKNFVSFPFSKKIFFSFFVCSTD